MKAARLFAPREVRIVDEDRPTPGPGKVLVQVKAVAICPSDLRMYVEGHASGVKPDHPMIQGHEFAGIIAEVGEGVSAKLQPGMAVAIEPSWHCGECDLCKRGLVNLCRHVIFPSFPQEDGALREYIVCPDFSVYPIPDGVGMIEAALVEPLGVAVHAVRLAEITGGERIAILGAGMVGMAVMQVAQAHGAAPVAMAEPREDRWGLPQDSGAEVVCHSWEEIAQAWAKPEQQPDVVFECSGDREAVEQAMRLVRPAGKVIIVGIPHPDEVTFNSCYPRRKELTIIFARRSRNALEESMELVEQGKVNLKAFPVVKFTLDQTQDAMETALQRPPGMLRAIVEM